MTADITNFVRDLKSKDITISISGEIRHIGGKNSSILGAAKLIA